MTDRALMGAVIAMGVYGASCSVLLPVEALVSRITPDDGFFYLVVGRNTAAGNLSSFNGIDLTNGYHPLWAVAVAGLASLPLGTEEFFRMMLVTNHALLGLAGLVLRKTLSSLVPASLAALSLSLYGLFVLSAGWYLTEASLAILMFSLTLFFILAPGLHVDRRAWAYPLSALTVLSRLDAAIVLAPALLLLFSEAVRPTQNGRRRLLHPLVASVGFALPLSFYVLSNLVLFGHAVPISGVIKSAFPTLSIPSLSAGNLGQISRLPFALFGPIALAAALALRTDRITCLREKRHLRFGFALAGGAVTFFLYDLLFQRDFGFAVFSWHFAVTSYLSLCLMSIGLGLLRIPNQVQLMAIVGFLLISGVGLHRKYSSESSAQSALRDAFHTANWIRQSTPPNTSLAATDAGIVAYFSERATTNLDGLINNLTYQQVLREGRLDAYLDERAVTHLVMKGFFPNPSGDFSYRIPARLYPGHGDILTLDFADRVYASPTGRFHVFKRRNPRDPQ